MTSVQPLLPELGLAAIRTLVVRGEPGPTHDVDKVLAAAGVRVMAHSDSDDALRTGVDIDLIVVVARAVDRRLCDKVKMLRESHPGSTIVLVVRTASRGSLAAALEAGAGAVVLREAVPIALGPAIRAAEADQISIPRGLGSLLYRPVLTRREKQTLAMLVLGLSNGEIAGKLHVTESTVKSHLSTAFAKLGVRSRSEATAAILDPDTGLGTGILAISPERAPLDLKFPTASTETPAASKR